MDLAMAIYNLKIPFLDLQAITRQHADEYQAAIARVIQSGWFLQGAEINRFEAEFAQYVGSAHCISVANGLDALYLILRAYREMGVLHDGDEVIVPANTYIATILAITRNHLIPVLVEPTWQHLQIDPDRIASAITPRTRAVMIVHLYGRLAFTPLIRELCERHHLKLIEDCAQSHGCTWQDIRTGALGDAAAHSFYPGKNIGAFGDAGAVTTSDPELADLVRALANYGSQQKYVFRYEGINSRMSEPDAAVLSVKLRYLDADNAHRQQVAAYYYKHIQNPLITLPTRLPDAQNVYHQFPIFSPHRDQLQAHLRAHGIGTLIHYPIPPHHQECYRHASWNDPVLSLPITERIHAQELSLPIHQALTLDQAAEVVSALNQFCL